MADEGTAKSRDLTGSSFEEEVYSLLSRALTVGGLGLQPHRTAIYRRRQYYSRERERSIVTDITLEVTLENADAPFFIWIWECKDYADRKVGIEDVEEFDAKLQQIGANNTKGTLVTKSGFTETAIRYAKARKIGLARITPEQLLTHLYYNGPPSEAEKALSALMLSGEDDQKTDTRFAGVGVDGGFVAYTNFESYISQQLYVFVPRVHLDRCICCCAYAPDYALDVRYQAIEIDETKVPESGEYVSTWIEFPSCRSCLSLIRRIQSNPAATIIESLLAAFIAIGASALIYSHPERTRWIVVSGVLALTVIGAKRLMRFEARHALQRKIDAANKSRSRIRDIADFGEFLLTFAPSINTSFWYRYDGMSCRKRTSSPKIVNPLPYDVSAVSERRDKDRYKLMAYRDSLSALNRPSSVDPASADKETRHSISSRKNRFIFPLAILGAFSLMTFAHDIRGWKAEYISSWLQAWRVVTGFCIDGLLGLLPDRLRLQLSTGIRDYLSIAAITLLACVRALMPYVIDGLRSLKPKQKLTAENIWVGAVICTVMSLVWPFVVLMFVVLVAINVYAFYWPFGNKYAKREAKRELIKEPPVDAGGFFGAYIWTAILIAVGNYMLMR